MRRVVLAAVVLGIAGATASAVGARARPQRPVSASTLLTSAQQMLVVTTPGWNAVGGTLRAFERADRGAWVEARLRGAARPPADAGTPIVVGKSGTAWDPGVVAPVGGPIKAEGDGRSPAGVFALGMAFGFAPAADARWVKLPYTHITPTLECVDDAASADYNRLVDRATTEGTWASSEKMRETTPWYHWGVVVEYNTRPVVAKRGSCIFLHMGGEGGRGTAGCTAMAEPALVAIMRWLDPKAAPVLVQMPVDAYAAMRGAWGLPELRAAR